MTGSVGAAVCGSVGASVVGGCVVGGSVVGGSVVVSAVVVSVVVGAVVATVVGTGFSVVVSGGAVVCSSCVVSGTSFTIPKAACRPAGFPLQHLSLSRLHFRRLYAILIEGEHAAPFFLLITYVLDRKALR